MNKIQLKDAYTEEHCNRTGNLALRIGIKLGLVNEALNELLFASKIHDLGKINVAIDILNKPGKYNTEAFAILDKDKGVLWDEQVVAALHEILSD